jgi:hypothetical protein
MKRISLLLVVVLCLAGLRVVAQDRMYKKNGEIIEIKLLRLSSTEITFKKFDNLDGPEYSIPKGDVVRIRYANGSSDVFEENNDKLGVDDKGRSIGAVRYMDKKSAPKDQNIIAFAPIAFTENGYGFSLSYERTLDKRGWVSFYFPTYFTFSSSQSYDPVTGASVTHNFHNGMFYLMPGIKFYTNLNSPNRMKHSVGLNLVTAFGSSDNNNDINYNSTSTYSRTMVGAIASYGGNMFPTNHLYLGWDAGMGMSYVNDWDGQPHSTQFLIQLSLRCGYRFTGKVRP